MRHTHYDKIDYRKNCKNLIGIPFDIETKLYSTEQLHGAISTFHCVAALRKALYDSLHIHLPPCYISDLSAILRKEYGYDLISVDAIQNGDIVFLKKNSRSSVSHVVLGLDQNQIFHSCRSRNTLIELFDCLYNEYFVCY